MQAIFEIDNNRKAPKYLQIVHSVTKSIKLGKLKNGDRLLSINELSNEFLLARDTVQKAYNILEQDGILLPVKGKGFYINKTDFTAQFLTGDYAAVYHNCIKDIISVLEDGRHLLKKFKKLILVYPKIPEYEEMVIAFRTFCRQNNFRHTLLNDTGGHMEVCENEAYIIIEETDLVAIIKKCHLKGLRPGKNIGILSYNDTPLKEILLGGITVISIDHGKMGDEKTKRIAEIRNERTLNPFSLIVRKSL